MYKRQLLLQSSSIDPGVLIPRYERLSRDLGIRELAHEEGVRDYLKASGGDLTDINTASLDHIYYLFSRGDAMSVAYYLLARHLGLDALILSDQVRMAAFWRDVSQIIDGFTAGYQDWIRRMYGDAVADHENVQRGLEHRIEGREFPLVNFSSQIQSRILNVLTASGGFSRP